MSTRRSWRGAILAWLFFGACCAIVVIGKAWGHSEGGVDYPIDCCSGHDCAVVGKVEWLHGQEVTFSRFGIHVVPKDLPKRVSPNWQMHVCIRHGRMICVFYPMNARLE